MRKGLKAEGGQFDKNIFNYEDYDAAGLDEFLKLNDAYVIAKMHFADDSSFNQGSFELPERFYSSIVCLWVRSCSPFTMFLTHLTY